MDDIFINKYIYLMKEDGVLNIQPLGFPWKTHDPFLTCVYHKDDYPAGNDQMGPAASLEGRNLGQDFTLKDGWRMYHGKSVPGFPAHPHRGFETVTIVLKGLVDHSDSLGCSGRYGNGDVQWLTTGKGVQHSEMFPLVNQDTPNHLELFQIWLNLPAAKKFATPHFLMLWADTIPRYTFKDHQGKITQVLIIAGKIEEVQPPSPPPESYASDPQSEVAIWNVEMEADAQWSLPAALMGVNRSLYFYEGLNIIIGNQNVAVNHGVDVQADRKVLIKNGPQKSRMLLLQGNPIKEPVAQYGPFVMNTHQQIQEAMEDYQKTEFGGWPWPRHDQVHARQAGKFADYK